MPNQAPHADRFEDRMKGILTETQILRRDIAGTAHRIIAEGVSEEYLRNPNKNGFLREEDPKKNRFNEEVRNKVESLLMADLKTHVLFRHLPKGKNTALTDEALYWDIKLQGREELGKNAAHAIFGLSEWLHGLPKEAHGILCPIHYEGYAQGHATRVGIYSGLIAQKLRDSYFEEDMASVAGFLHDLGKLLPSLDQLVREPRKLNDAEYELVKLHPLLGASLWNQIRVNGFLPEARIKTHLAIHDGILEHHLRPDMRGYPPCAERRFKSPIGQIVAIADAFDAMTSHRSYDQPKSDPLDYAFEELKRCSGLPWDEGMTTKKEPDFQFNPQLVQLLLEFHPEPIFRRPMDHV